MHETQYVKALTDSFDEAQALFRAHVERLGGPDNWWTLMAAWDERTKEIRVPPPEPLSAGLLEDLTAEEIEEHTRSTALEHEGDARMIREEYATGEPWIRAAWECAASGYAVGGLPWMTFGEPSDDNDEALERFRAIPLDDLAAQFLAAARAALAESDPPPQRVGLAKACAMLEQALADHHAAPHLPFLREQGPYTWPAHLVGDGDPDGAIYLMIDMHR